MEFRYILLFTAVLLSSSQSYELYKTLCEGSLCLYLYDTHSGNITWEDSLMACRDEGLEMLMIESSQTQTTVDRFLDGLMQEEWRTVWIGGRGSSNDTWMYMNGTETGKSVVNESEPDPHCVRIRLCKNDITDYVADNCDERTSSSWILCQYDTNKTGECHPSHHNFGDKCYVKTRYDGGDRNKIDWYSGQTYCSQSPIQGDIAYSYLDDNQHINDVVSLLGGGDGCVELWLGVRRRIWFWHRDSDAHTDRQPINYFNWYDDAEIQASDDSCIYIDGDRGNKWRARNCTDPSLRYFLCMSASTLSTPARNCTVEITDNSINMALIIAVMICVVLFAITVCLIVLLLRYRRIMSLQRSTINQTEMDTNDITIVVGSSSLPDTDKITPESDQDGNI